MCPPIQVSKGFSIAYVGWLPASIRDPDGDVYYANNLMYGTDFYTADDCKYLWELRHLIRTLEKGSTDFPDENPGILYEGMLHVAVMRSRCNTASSSGRPTLRWDLTVQMAGTY